MNTPVSRFAAGGSASPELGVPATGGRGLLVAAAVSVGSCCLAGGLGCAGYLSDPTAADFTTVVIGVPVVALTVAALIGGGVGWWSGRADIIAGRGQPQALILIAAILLGALPAVLAYMTARMLATRSAAGAGRRQETELAQAWVAWDAWWAQHPDPLRAAGVRLGAVGTPRGGVWARAQPSRPAGTRGQPARGRVGDRAARIR